MKLPVILFLLLPISVLAAPSSQLQNQMRATAEDGHRAVDRLEEALEVAEEQVNELTTQLSERDGEIAKLKAASQPPKPVDPPRSASPGGALPAQTPISRGP